MAKRSFGTRAACTRCGQDIEWHGRKAGWIDRGASRSCLPYRDRAGELVKPKGKHTIREG
jgi:hypothetical protein